MSTNFEDLILRDITANRPAAGKPGRLFFDTTLNKLQRDNGSTWQDVESVSTSYTDENAQDAIGAMIADTDTIDLTYTDAMPELKGDVKKQMSITSDSSGLKLSGDSATPGNNKVYGTDGSGTKGWKADPSGSGSASRVLIATASPSGTGTVTFSSIPGTYKHLTIEVIGRSTLASATANAVYIFLNGDNTATNYRRIIMSGSVNNTIGADGVDNSYVFALPAANSPSNSAGIAYIHIPFYANTTWNKQITAQSSQRRTSGDEETCQFGIEWENTAAITQIVLSVDTGNWVAGSIINLYGEQDVAP